MATAMSLGRDRTRGVYAFLALALLLLQVVGLVQTAGAQNPVVEFHTTVKQFEVWSRNLDGYVVIVDNNNHPPRVSLDCGASWTSTVNWFGMDREVKFDDFGFGTARRRPETGVIVKVVDLSNTPYRDHQWRFQYADNAALPFDKGYREACGG